MPSFAAVARQTCAVITTPISAATITALCAAAYASTAIAATIAATIATATIAAAAITDAAIDAAIATSADTAAAIAASADTSLLARVMKREASAVRLLTAFKDMHRQRKTGSG